MTGTVLLLRAAVRVVRPWKNGGGTTQDVALFPPDAGLADFGWRLSIAQVGEAGPFSIFPGVDRHLAILDGRMALAIAGQAERPPLTVADDPLVFPGDVETTGRPIDGPVTDLNLMVRRDTFDGRLRSASSLALTTDCDTTLLIAREAMTVTVGAQAIAMAPRDALRVPRGMDVRADAPLLFAQLDPFPDTRRI